MCAKSLVTEYVMKDAIPIYSSDVVPRLKYKSSIKYYACVSSCLYGDVFDMC